MGSVSKADLRVGHRIFTAQAAYELYEQHHGVTRKYIYFMHSGNKEQNICSVSQITFLMFAINIYKIKEIQVKDAKHLPLSEFLQKDSF